MLMLRTSRRRREDPEECHRPGRQVPPDLSMPQAFTCLDCFSVDSLLLSALWLSSSARPFLSPSRALVTVRPSTHSLTRRSRPKNEDSTAGTAESGEPTTERSHFSAASEPKSLCLRNLLLPSAATSARGRRPPKGTGNGRCRFWADRQAVFRLIVTSVGRAQILPGATTSVDLSLSRAKSHRTLSKDTAGIERVRDGQWTCDAYSMESRGLCRVSLPVIRRFSTQRNHVFRWVRLRTPGKPDKTGHTRAIPDLGQLCRVKSGSGVASPTEG